MKNNDARRAKGRLIEKGRRLHPEMDTLLTDISNGVACTPEWIEKMCDGWYIEGEQQKMYITHLMRYALQNNILLIVPELYHHIEWDMTYLDTCQCYVLQDFDWSCDFFDHLPFNFLYISRAPSIHMALLMGAPQKLFMHGVMLNLRSKSSNFRNLQDVEEMCLDRLIECYSWDIETDRTLIVRLVETIFDVCGRFDDDDLPAFYNVIKHAFLKNISAYQGIVFEHSSLEEMVDYLKHEMSSLPSEEMELH